MYLTYKQEKFKKSEDRKEFALLVSKLFPSSSYQNYAFEPFCPVIGNNYFWNVENSNNWKIKFDNVNYNTVEIYHKHYDANKMLALANWIKIITHAEEVVLETKDKRILERQQKLNLLVDLKFDVISLGSSGENE